MVSAAVFTYEAAIAISCTLAFNLGLALFNTRNPIWRRCSHVNLVLVSNRRRDTTAAASSSTSVATTSTSTAAGAAGRPETWFCWDVISSKDSLCGPIGVLGLTLFRAFQCIVFAFTIIYGNILYEPAGSRFFIYFTNWTFVLFGLTGLAGTVLTAREWMRRRRPTIPCIESSKPVSSLQSWGWPQRFYHLLLTTTCSASIMLTLFYWFADYLPGSDLRFDNPVKHGASSLLLLLDVALSRTALVSFHLQVVIAYGTVYLVFLWSYYAVTGTWVYRALDWTRFMSIPYYCALPLLLMLGFTVMFAVASLRELLINCSCSCGRRRRRRQQSEADAVMAIQGNNAASQWPSQHHQQIEVLQAPAAQQQSRSPRLAIALTPLA